ncbi:hypothetical protein [Micromonospora sp. NPDC047134]|uniref:hypothetical protein n=1 Tax=Micromonospora sp. NPDC047134 TaxID=3154340 RepID=UPI003406425C
MGVTAGELIVEELDAVLALPEDQLDGSHPLIDEIMERLAENGEPAPELLRAYRVGPEGRADLVAALDRAGAARWSKIAELESSQSRQLRQVSIKRAQNIQVGDHNIQFFDQSIKGWYWIPALVALVVAASAGTYAVLDRPSTEPLADARPRIVASVDPNPVPAPAASPPVLVESITPMESNVATRDFVLPRSVEITNAQLETLGPGQLISETGWFREQEGTAVDFGTFTMTLRGNADEQVRITEMRVVKSCAGPLSGTYFYGYSQGSGDTLKIGFDMDDPSPIAQRLGYSESRGFFPTGEPYFSLKPVTLDPGEKETLLIGAFTKRQSCTFTLRLVVSTSSGAFFQDIDQGGRPFRITATALERHVGAPLSGYARAYAYLVEPDGTRGRWQPVDPATFGRE